MEEKRRGELIRRRGERRGKGRGGERGEEERGIGICQKAREKETERGRVRPEEEG